MEFGELWRQPDRCRGTRAGRDRRHVFPARARRVGPSFTDVEYADVAAAARRAGLTPTGFCALAALAVARGDTGPGRAVEEREALAGLQAELFEARTAVNRVGTNLNQAVAALHTVGEPPLWLRTVVEMCARSIAALDQVAAVVHRRLR